MAVALIQDMLRRHHSMRGQTGTEYLLVVSAVVIAIVAAGYGFVRSSATG